MPYIAHFKVEKKEPKVMHFSIGERESKILKFSVQKQSPIKFKIRSNFDLDVESN